MKNIFFRPLKNSWVFFTGLLLISILSYSAILIPREIPFLKTISVLARYNSTRFLPISAILLLAALSLKDRRLSVITTALVFFPLFSLALNGLWAGAYSENYILSGLLPRSDAFGFYTGSVALLENGFLSGMASRRPLYGGFLAFILWITGGNLQITLSIIVFLTAAVCFFSTLEVKNALNPSAAVLYFIVLFLFIRRFIGITMSENMGFILATSSFTLLLIALRKFKQNPKDGIPFFLFSTLLYSLSQAARPGAVAVLPLLILFSGWLWKGKGKLSWKLMLIVTIVVVAGFGINTLIFSATTPGNSVQMNNIGYGIYGLAVGGKGWQQIFTDHPEVTSLEPGVREQRIMEIVLQEISSHPENFIKGIIVQFKVLFSLQPTNSLFSFVYSKNNVFSYGLISLFFLLSTVGVATVVIHWKKLFNAFILLLTLGFLLSLPFAPAFQTRYMRVYAASIPLLGILPAFGLYTITQHLPEKIRKFGFFRKPKQEKISSAAMMFTAILVSIILIGPIAVKLFSPSESPTHPGCPEGQSEVVLRYYPGSSIHIFKNTPDIMTWVPNITQLDYKGSIHNICCGDEIIYFENIPVPNVLFPTINLLNNNHMYMIVDSSLLPEKKTLLHICGRIEDVHGELSNSGFLYPQTISAIQ